ncbi:MAG: 3-deoxy-D-manno-octulosonic acid transferase [Candidatus Omnitrophota bacterium]
MRLLYDLAFLIFGIFYLPYLIITKRYKYGMKERFGILPKKVKELSRDNKIIWIHGVSVGEIKLATILAPLFRKMFPNHKIIFSTVTGTGNKIARGIRKNDEAIIYLPFDISMITNRVVKMIKPEIFICLETELWPNLISSLDRYSSKIILLNGRISQRSFLGYKKIGYITKNILEKFSLILMQSEEDRARIIELGAVKEKAYVTGNLKFDLSTIKEVPLIKETRGRLGLEDKEVLLIGGSTHKGEEKVLLECYRKLKESYKNLRLLLAPRHPERTRGIEKFVRKNGLEATRISNLFTDHGLRITDHVFILDTIGELKDMYSAGDLVFMGGSLVKKGGQNLIEPANFEKPVIIGKYVFNFHDVVNIFIKNNACIQVSNRSELYTSLKKLLDSHKERKELGVRARKTVLENQGSAQRSLDLILSAYHK